MSPELIIVWFTILHSISYSLFHMFLHLTTHVQYYAGCYYRCLPLSLSLSLSSLLPLVFFNLIQLKKIVTMCVCEFWCTIHIKIEWNRLVSNCYFLFLFICFYQDQYACIMYLFAFIIMWLKLWNFGFSCFSINYNIWLSECPACG